MGDRFFRKEFGKSGSQKSKKHQQSQDWPDLNPEPRFLDFGDPDFPNSFRRNDPPWPLRANHCVEKDPIWILSMLGFRNKLSKVLVFTNQIQLFHENPVSSVRPSETSSFQLINSIH